MSGFIHWQKIMGGGEFRDEERVNEEASSFFLNPVPVSK